MSCPAVNVPVTVWIVRKTDQTEPARDAAEIPGLLADANKILWQNGLTLVQSGTVHYADNDAWLNPSNTTPAAVYEFDALMDSSSGTGGVELYFVQTITGEKGGLKGVKRIKGIAIAQDGDASTIAHEVLHACGLDDIYPQITIFAGHQGLHPGRVRAGDAAVRLVRRLLRAGADAEVRGRPPDHESGGIRKRAASPGRHPVGESVGIP